MLKTTLWILFAVLIAALIVIAPNTLWLSRSSALIHNNGAAVMTLRLVITGESDRFIEAGVLAPGASRFLWIDPVGEATLAIEVRDGDTWRRHCGEYIEAGMYRVEITARAPDEVTCRTELPFLDRLLVLDYLS